MRTWVVLAPPEQAENVRQALHRLGILRRDVRAIRAEHEVAFPVESLPEPPLEHTRVEERELPSKAAPPGPTVSCST